MYETILKILRKTLKLPCYQPLVWCDFSLIFWYNLMTKIQFRIRNKDMSKHKKAKHWIHALTLANNDRSN